MIKRDIVTRVSMKMGIPKVKAELAVDSVFQVLKAAMHNGDRIELRRVRRLQHQAPQKRRGEKPQNGARGPYPARKNRPF